MLNKKKNLYTLRMTQTCKLCTINYAYNYQAKSCTWFWDIGFVLICLHLYFYLLQIALTLINNWRQKGKQMPHKLQKKLQAFMMLQRLTHFLRFMQVQIVLLKWEKGSLWERKCLKKKLQKNKIKWMSHHCKSIS